METNHPTQPAAVPAAAPASIAASAPSSAQAQTPGSPAVTSSAGNTIQYDDFAKIELKVATIIEAKVHPNADKLLVLQIDLGDEKRQICAGIKTHYTPEQLVGMQIIVVKNLAPRSLRGEISHGMLLAATDGATGNVVLLAPSVPVGPGSAIK